ncbi:MAG TPA: tRNA (N6-threonylcarbamoyladenosine(37)-N6)-methyltransferase TrmO [Methanomassiliicoccaceae archaeon]|jgi:tRNA-Thr(GGU) m(6)t(6)A37 methyltransferase TsaA|nr:tRNA (N6-threonylcarbamoyladenosine(37)-N6)-methyltransferase TrmO [Euryarchaeota archaeon]HOB38448.1 tRNA (N6-threonylcarbamoyladenosine(37)-N6)-methyltransferase TrmO [Methanomassiliicoccaceae archaeon]HOL07681.1 tRNA (N6-threonylcarbamoyladenosine(37)-N6)-methyltransferase TrmO [Methanomassiliicoccaceae archaeon]HOQ25936.1 tRNA (N6-threonylcarbamoyladenosine(37)-N6)-methyltransferase TrmO [Methanomassiliicoccaceae archaeon]HPT73642.1 tRNA (N6-threonylcarbamoyladenosine(37)-N6)-methyltrans
MELRPVGRVAKVEGGRSEIEVLQEYAEGLFGIEKCDSLLILFFFDRSDRVDLKVHPRGDPRNPLVGVFASRSPNRPNHIGATVVRLVGVMNNILTVEGLDAWEGTPVLDIKPGIVGWNSAGPCHRLPDGKE